MAFYRTQHELYCGVDLHARRMYTCVIDSNGRTVFHKNLNCTPQDLEAALEPFRDRDIVLAVESTFNWYWLADACDELNIPFVLGHAYGMRSIHGGKTKNDKQDSLKIAQLLRGGNLPVAWAYPKAMRSQRDLCRRRCYFTRQRAELQAHVRSSCLQYNVAAPSGQLRYATHQEGLAEAFPTQASQLTIETDIAMINALTTQISRLEKTLVQMAQFDDAGMFYRLKAVPGIGDILALVILYEIGDLKRFRRAGDFLSYARLVPGQHSSAGKNYGSPGRKQGNPQLKWAFSEAVALLLRDSPATKAAFAKMEKRHGRGKALSILAARLGRAVYLVLKRGDIFSEREFLRLPDDARVDVPKPRRRRKAASKATQTSATGNA
ncbi:IS110 family transposase [Fuerstiella marisgermanici]|uniref:Transposase IS116/IS110/IS902 family protein n=1 Tax=Fuerstiella marisgermanici TaxID=1891926 RepID=A0A1P8WG44_9PLAN|nr:IS110 family transposase [Fuerstiella marisgermanici]APZ93014.1 Transposase IS116/IS110/IS902 family protein [Fuerstiella marisgermanici]